MDEINKINKINEINEKIADYINSLSIIEKKALEIAKIQLESSFDIEKSIGFIEWLKNNN